MGQTRLFRLPELRQLHRQLLSTTLLLAALTAIVLGYMAVRIFLVPAAITFTEMGRLTAFAAACVLLSTVQLHCLRQLRSDTRERVETAVFVDPLTQAFNYRYATVRLDEELSRAREAGASVAAVYFDLDHFKLINDVYGHEAGNEALRRVAYVARMCCRPCDLVARLGGDEFLLILPRTDAAEAAAVAGRILSQVEALRLSADGDSALATLGLSVGIATYPETAGTRDALIRAADDAMYRAKRVGGDAIVAGPDCVLASTGQADQA